MSKRTSMPQFQHPSDTLLLGGSGKHTRVGLTTPAAVIWWLLSLKKGTPWQLLSCRRAWMWWQAVQGCRDGVQGQVEQRVEKQKKGPHFSAAEWTADPCLWAWATFKECGQFQSLYKLKVGNGGEFKKKDCLLKQVDQWQNKKVLLEYLHGKTANFSNRLKLSNANWSLTFFLGMSGTWSMFCEWLSTTTTSDFHTISTKLIKKANYVFSVDCCGHFKCDCPFMLFIGGRQLTRDFCLEDLNRSFCNFKL